MKTMLLSLFSLTLSQSILIRPNLTCTAGSFINGSQYADEHSLAEYKGKTSAECCAYCNSNDKCVAWSWKEGGLFDKEECYLHSDTQLEPSKRRDWVCGHAPPPAPTPPPPPTPPPAPTPGTNWVVIAAGSKTYANYRHQADACHAYQIVAKNGVHPDNIIMMMEDDVANAGENPFPGKLFNKPTAKGVPGVDVYAGCKIDYKGKVVTAQLFLDVLQGNADAVKGKGNGKVLKSGPNDKVFVNFVDHGGGQIVEFPNGPYMHAKDLVATLATMNEKKLYGKMMFYMEACNGGSMFAGLLPNNTNIFATTAASPSEPSWGTYCPPQDKVNGKNLKTCLGDLYSVNWMQDSDSAYGLGRSLEGQYEQVVKTTIKSHPQEYGDQSFRNQYHVSDFQAVRSASPFKAAAANPRSAADAADAAASAVDSRDIELTLAFYAYLRAPAATAADRAARSELAQALVGQVQAREAADATFTRMLAKATAAPALSALAAEGVTAEVRATCGKTVNEVVVARCGRYSSYSLKFSAALVELCNTRDVQHIADAVESACPVKK